MADDENDLSRAVVLYIAFDTAASPRARPEAVIAEFGPEQGATLAAEVVELIKEARVIEVDWSTLSLAEAGEYAKSIMAQRHPELSPHALDAIAWKWTFDWR